MQLFYSKRQVVTRKVFWWQTFSAPVQIISVSGNMGYVRIWGMPSAQYHSSFITISYTYYVLGTLLGI